MNEQEIIKKIFLLKEITIKNKEAFIKDQKVNFMFIRALRLFSIIEMSGGNFETQEEYYKLNDIFYKIENNNIIILLSKIINSIQRHGIAHDEFRNIFIKFQNNEIRKEKLKRLNHLR